MIVLTPLYAPPTSPSAANRLFHPLSTAKTVAQSGKPLGSGSTQLNRPHPTHYIAPEELRHLLEQTIQKRRLPHDIIEYARNAGNAGSTISGNFRIDVSHWKFPKQPFYGTDSAQIGPLPPPSIVTELFSELKDLGYISSQVMEYTAPCIMRLVFYTEKGARMFLEALKVKVVHYILSK